jgi:hypothetical protein
MENQDFKSFKKALLEQESSNKLLILLNHSTSLSLWHLPKKFVYIGIGSLSLLSLAAFFWLFNVPRPTLDVTAVKSSLGWKSTLLSDIGSIKEGKHQELHAWEVSTKKQSGGYILAISTNIPLFEQDSPKIVTKTFASLGAVIDSKVKGLWKLDPKGQWGEARSIIKLLIPKEILANDEVKTLDVSVFRNGKLEASLEIDFDKFKQRLAPEMALNPSQEDSL